MLYEVIPRAEISPFFGDRIHQRAVFNRVGIARHLAVIHPGMPRLDGAFRPLGYREAHKGAFLFHTVYLSVSSVSMVNLAFIPLSPASW